MIFYYSKRFSAVERRYCVTCRELLAIIKSIKHFHHYLYGRLFKVRTDHGSLTWHLNFKNPEGQIARWFQLLSQYEFKIEHRAGKSHDNPAPSIASTVIEPKRNITPRRTPYIIRQSLLAPNKTLKAPSIYNPPKS